MTATTSAPTRRPVASRVAAGVLMILVAIAVLGPLVAPHAATHPVGSPYAAPGPDAPLGTDQLGRDVLSRVLHGGLPVLTTSFLAALLGSAAGVAIGLAAALAGARRPWVEGLLMRPLDAVVALPSLFVVLLALTALPGRAGIIVAVAVSGAPLTARVIRAAAAPVVARPHVEVAVARGERLPWVLGRELLPLVAGQAIADAGLRFVLAVYLVTAAGFLGFGVEEADWGSLINQALPGAQLQPVALAVPVVLVAALGVSVNVLADVLLVRSRAVLA